MRGFFAPVHRLCASHNALDGRSESLHQFGFTEPEFESNIDVGASLGEHAVFLTVTVAQDNTIDRGVSAGTILAHPSLEYDPVP